MSFVWRKGFLLSREEVKVLEALKDLPVDKPPIDVVAERTGLSPHQVKALLEKLREKGVLREISGVFDPLKVYDEVFVALIKVAVRPPVVGVPIDYPTGWNPKPYIDRIKEAQKRLGIDIVRAVFTLQGTYWDLLLLVYPKNFKEFTLFCSELAKQGWIDMIQSFRLIDVGEWLWDPVKSPSERDHEEGVEKWRTSRQYTG